MSLVEPYQPDRTWKGKLRRRLVRLAHRRPLAVAPERPMVSFSFDDAPLSAAVTGAAILEGRDVRGTFYVCAGLAGSDAPMGRCAAGDDYRRLARAGHEIACHTFAHLDLGRTPAAEALADGERNAAVLTEWAGATPETFAYPYGDVAAGPKQALAPRFRLLRALHHGLVEMGCDLNQAPAVGVEGPDGEALARRWLAAAKARKAWLILYTHDVRSEPSRWGCTPDALAGLVDEARSKGFEIVTVAEGARLLGA